MLNILVADLNDSNSICLFTNVNTPSVVGSTIIKKSLTVLSGDSSIILHCSYDKTA